MYKEGAGSWDGSSRVAPTPLCEIGATEMTEPHDRVCERSLRIPPLAGHVQGQRLDVGAVAGGNSWIGSAAQPASSSGARKDMDILRDFRERSGASPGGVPRRRGPLLVDTGHSARR